MSEAENSYSGYDLDLDLALEGIIMSDDTKEMEGLIKTIGEQIEETRESLSSDWQALADETQLKLETDKITSIKAISKFFQEKIKIEEHGCTTEPINLNVFLNNVVQALERNVGQEEKIFDELINFFAEQGLVLPAALPEEVNHDITRSTASLNVVFSRTEEDMSVLWEKITKLVSTGLLSSIDKLGLAQNSKEVKTKLLRKKVALLEKLCILFHPCDVWRKYLGMRKSQSERFLTNVVSLGDFDGSIEYLQIENMPNDVINLVRCSHVLTIMLEEDYSLFGVGMFPDASQLQTDEIFTVYLSSFGNELREVIKNLHSFGRRSSVKQPVDNSVLPSDVFLAFRQCVLAASAVDNAAKKLLNSLHFCFSTPMSTGLSDTFGSTTSIPGSSNGTKNTDDGLNKVVRDEPDVSNEDFWQWQDEFKPAVSKLALAIVENIQSLTRRTLEDEIEQYEKTGNYEAVNILGEQFNGLVDCPKQVAKSCVTITGKVDELLSFLLLGGRKEFDAIRTSVSESLATALMTYQSRLIRISSDVPKSSPITNLYLIFNSALFIKHTVKQYEEEGKFTGSLCSVYSDLVQSLYEKIISYHYATVATVILQDVTSHHWINQKEFFEGERCSFSVQMWNYYMQGLQHDLWKMCAPKYGQTIFSSVLQYSLSCFVRRYSKAIPSYKRTTLLRLDITTLLFSVSSWLIFTVSTTLKDIFNPDPTRDLINDIHNSCSALLAIMTIISCPLETLCLFTSGGAEELIKDGLTTNTSWLSWLHSDLYGEHCKRILALNDVQAANIYFKLMINQPQPVWGLVLQTLLSRNAYLAVTIVTYLESHFLQLHVEDSGVALKKIRVQFRDQCIASEHDSEEHCQSIVGSLYYVIFKCSKTSKPLINFIIALMNRENSWQIFTSVEGLRLRDDDRAPVWLDCLYSTMKRFTQRLTQIALSELCGQNQSTSKSFKFSAINSLPCGCEVAKQTSTKKRKDKTELVYAAFEKVLKCLLASLSSIPRILFQVFNRIEGDLRQLKLTSSAGCSAGLKILGSILFRSFSAVKAEDVSEELHFDASIAENCSQLSQLLYHVMMGDLEGFCQRTGLPVALETIINQKKTWIDEQVKKIDDIISANNESEEVAASSQDDFLQLQFDLEAKNLLLDLKGEKALKQFYLFCQAKKFKIQPSMKTRLQDWIMRRIPISSHLGSPQEITTKPSIGTFDSLHAHRSLGDYSFDHSAIQNFPFDWEQMFQNNIGMPLKSFKRLVYNRWELHDEKNVDEDKLALLEKLKAFYARESDIV